MPEAWQCDRDDSTCHRKEGNPGSYIIHRNGVCALYQLCASRNSLPKSKGMKDRSHVQCCCLAGELTKIAHYGDLFEDRNSPSSSGGRTARPSHALHTKRYRSRSRSPDGFDSILVSHMGTAQPGHNGRFTLRASSSVFCCCIDSSRPYRREHHELSAIDAWPYCR